jgi:DNA-binding NtrC family response regulator
LVGRHVVVLAARREVRNVVRTSLRPMGLMVDFVTSVEELRQLVADGLPHAVVYEAAIAGEPFERLRREILAEAPAMVFVRISDEGKAFEVLNVGGRQFTSVGRDAIMVALPEALTFEFSRADEAAARKA